MALSTAIVRRISSKLLPSKAYNKLTPILDLADEALSSSSERAKSLRIAMFSFFVRVLSAILVFASQIFLARFLGGFEYGIFVLVWTTAIILGGLCCLGVHSAALRFITVFQTNSDLDRLRGIVFGAPRIAFAAAISTTIIGLLVLYMLRGILDNHYLAPFALALAILPLLALAETLDEFGRAFDRVDIAFLPTFILRPLLLLGFMVFAITYGFATNAITALICAMASVFIALTLQWWTLREHINKTVPQGGRILEPILWLKTAMPIFLANGFFELLTQMDVLLLGIFVSPELIGPYYAAVKILALVHFVPFSVKAAIQPSFARMNEKENHAELSSFAKQATRWGFVPTLVIGLFVALIAPWILNLFGPNFSSTAPIVWLLMLGLIIRASIGPAESLLNMTGQQNLCALAYGCALMVNIALNLALIPLFGLWGAAIATVIALACEALALWLIVQKRLKINMFLI